MLAHLAIRGLVTIDSVEIDFGPGLTAITGDTGAGKSIVLDGLDLVLGGRADFALVRAGVDRAIVDAVFRVDEAVRARLREADIYDEAGGEMFLGRELSAGGRSVARLDGRPVPLALLREVASRLVDVHGQSEHLSLLRASAHQAAVDRFGRLQESVSRHRAAYDAWRSLESRRVTLQRAERDAAQRADLLRFQCQEIQGAALEPDEEIRLEAEHRRLANAQRLGELLAGALRALDGEDTSARDALAMAERLTRQAQQYDHAAGQVADRLLEVGESVAELAHELRRLLDGLEADPRRLAWVEERLETIGRLKRKYGATVAEVLAYAARAARELEEIEHHDAVLAEVTAAAARARERVAEVGWQLHRARQAAAARLEQTVAERLDELGLRGARFAVQVQLSAGQELVLPDGRSCTPGFDGIDDTGFSLAVNPGEPMRPLAQVASGGEMARIMLALKVALGAADAIPVLVFDEIDSGVGGRSADVIGRALARLAQTHQVICITHLPQVACYADHHLVVHKHDDGRRTFTSCRALDAGEVLVELSRMLGRESDATLRSAQELVDAAGAWKRQSLAAATAAR